MKIKENINKIFPIVLILSIRILCREHSVLTIANFSTDGQFLEVTMTTARRDADVTHLMAVSLFNMLFRYHDKEDSLAKVYYNHDIVSLYMIE